MGGAQPLAAAMNGAAFLGVEVDKTRAQKRVDTSYLDKISYDLDEALELVLKAKTEGRAFSVGLIGNAGEVFPEIINFAKNNGIKIAVNPGHDQLFKDLEILKHYHPQLFQIPFEFHL